MRNSVSKTSKTMMQLLSSPAQANTSKKSKMFALPPLSPKEDKLRAEDTSLSLL